MSHGDSNSAEPNLTPMLDMVFQLITFFMLVINFKSAALDLTLTLPVIGSARPVDTEGNEDLLVLNINKNGDLVIYNQVVPMHQFLQTEARVSRMKLAGPAAQAPETELPTTIVIRADKETSFKDLNAVFTECQRLGFRKFSMKAFNLEADSR